MKNPKANTLLKTKEDAIEFLDWIGLLESDFLFKGRRELESTADHYCCLAKGCLVTVPTERLNLEDDNRLFGTLPSEQVAPRWLKKVNTDFNSKYGETLVWLNDYTEMPHPELAALLLEVYTDELNQFDWP